MMARLLPTLDEHHDDYDEYDDDFFDEDFDIDDEGNDFFGEFDENEDFLGAIEPQEPYVREQPKIGRNEPCPCGSGKKYKKCCGK
jgi:preprotein translocase subunit SecA